MRAAYTTLVCFAIGTFAANIHALANRRSPIDLRHMYLRIFMKFSILLLAALLTNAAWAADAEINTQPLSPTQPSSTAQQLYASAQSDLLQLRVLLKNGNSQSSVGSGFLIGTSNLVVTNFHVISQIALEPETYFGEYKDTQGNRGTIELLAVDVLHDLAVVRVKPTGNGFFKVPRINENALVTLNQGQHLYSLGNPLDLGFTISEGTYNGISSRGFSDQLMFTGPVNPGMSGGPNITANGEVAGVNVAHRRDGELVSFLVPVRYVQALLERVITDVEREDFQPPSDFKPIIGEQLLQHQTLMVDKLLEIPFSIKALDDYRVPVRESDQVRCWGSANAEAKNPYSVATINCAMESQIFVSGDLQTGHISMRHQYIHNKKLTAMQFAHVATSFYDNQVYSTAKSETITPAECAEQFVALKNMSLRALVCTEAYHQFAGLYDFTLTTASSDDSNTSLQSMMNIQGVSYENGVKLISEFLQNIERLSPTENSTSDSAIEPEPITDIEKITETETSTEIKTTTETDNTPASDATGEAQP